ncbi:hypothetical protein HN011_004607 [Eciton burchellii]|nr:hypothetical protein HN011_004607 [Eciton burchellii]
MAKANKNGRFKYDDLYRICKANYTTSTTPEYTTETTVAETTTSAATEPSTTSTESTTMCEGTTVSDETSTTSSTRSEMPRYSEILSSTIARITTPKWTSSTRQSTSIATSTAMNITMETRSSVTFKTTRLISTDTMTTSATSTTAAPVETSSGTSSEISSKMTNTVETTDMSISSMLPSIAPPPTSSIPPPSISSMIPPTVLSTLTSMTTLDLTTFDSTITTVPNTVTENTSVNTVESTATTDINNCSESITTSFNHVVRYAVTNVACILIDMKIWINLRYAMDGSQTGKATLIVPAKARTTGDCHEKRGEMTLSWNETRTDSRDKENRIVFRYVHNDVMFFLDSVFVDVHLDSKNFPRAQQRRISGGGGGLQLFYAPVKDGIFTCMVDTAINVGNQITAVISEIRLIAFNNCNTSCWKTENNCISKININVSAIIGATIIGILVVVVVFYLIWRKRRNNFMTFGNFADYSFSRKSIVLKDQLYFDKHYREY